VVSPYITFGMVRVKSSSDGECGSKSVSWDAFEDQNDAHTTDEKRFFRFLKGKERRVRLGLHS